MSDMSGMSGMKDFIFFFSQHMLRVSFSPGRDRSRRHDWISPLGKRSFLVKYGALPSLTLNWDPFFKKRFLPDRDISERPDSSFVDPPLWIPFSLHNDIFENVYPSFVDPSFVGHSPLSWTTLWIPVLAYFTSESIVYKTILTAQR